MFHTPISCRRFSMFSMLTLGVVVVVFLHTTKKNKYYFVRFVLWPLEVF